MKYAFNLNEAIIQTLSRVYGGTNVLESYVGEVSDLRKKNIEFRDPTYVTRGQMFLNMGSEEANVAYIDRIENYKSKGDVMRIMRALAGITGQLIYVILWYIMLWQLIMFLFVYIKRYLMIAFLIAIFPITLLEFIVGSIFSGKQSSLTAWAKEFFVNVFIQTIHAIIYTIVSGVVISQTQNVFMEEGFARIDWFIYLCAINFVFAAEKVVVSIINAATTSVSSPGEVSSSVIKKGKDGKAKISKAISFLH